MTKENKRKAQKKDYYQANKDKIKAQHKIYREVNKDKKKAYGKTYYQAHKEERKASYRANWPIVRARYLNEEYGLTLDQYDELWVEQLGLCPICQKELPVGYGAAVDHNHITGQIRGLLHRSCNLILGSLKDDIQRLKNAIVYLGGDTL